LLGSVSFVGGVIVIFAPSLLTLAPNCSAIEREASVSSPNRKFLIVEGLLDKRENIAHLCEIDLSGAIVEHSKRKGLEHFEILAIFI
jgi:hypothetical protein